MDIELVWKLWTR